MKGIFESARDLFELANRSGIKYLVLRNYENILSPQLYVDGHGDIDLLCEDSIKFAAAVGANRFHGKVKEVCEDGYHYYIFIGGKRVSLDVRSVGDGYYCKKWEIDMLLNRVEHDGYYIMNKEDYFYSLVHHSILQKRTFSKDYQQRLVRMGNDLGLNLTEPKAADYVSLLEKYMKSRGYTYTYPKDIFVPLNKRNIKDKQLIEPNLRLAFLHWRFDSKILLLEKLIGVKHFLFKKNV